MRIKRGNLCKALKHLTRSSALWVTGGLSRMPYLSAPGQFSQPLEDEETEAHTEVKCLSPSHRAAEWSQGTHTQVWPALKSAFSPSHRTTKPKTTSDSSRVRP